MVERIRGHILAPTVDDVRKAAEANFLDLTVEEAEEMAAVIGGVCETIDVLDELPFESPPVRHTHRNPGRRPTRREDPFNSFVRRCEVNGAESGSLVGKTIAVKDNIAIAGIPMTNGSATASFVPRHDAVVVERILDEGGQIVGTLNMDAFAASGSGETSAFGPTLNPVNPKRTAGGSSGGAGAAVAANLVDIALGVDEGGSARIPAAYCGVLCLKPTYGLVPTFGLTYIDQTLDYICPLARTLDDLALTLEVIAGPDWRDPQHNVGDLSHTHYSNFRSEARSLAGMTVGVVREATLEGDCESAVLDGLERVKELLVRQGASLGEVSVPLWPHAWPISLAFQIHAATAMIESEGQGFGHFGYIDVDRQHAFGVMRRVEGRKFPPSMKLWLIAGRFLRDRYFNTYYGKAHNLRDSMRQQVTSVLRDVDALIMPSTPRVAPKLAEQRLTESQLIERGTSKINMALNTSPLNLSGHPAMTIPSGVDADGLPTSVQFVSGMLNEAALFRLASSVEEYFDEFVSGRR